jgi:hypothetical protein
VRGSTPAISAISTNRDECGSEATAMGSVITAGGGRSSPLAAAVSHQLSIAEGVSAAGGRGANEACIDSNSSGRGRDDVSSRRRVFFT